MMDVSIKKLDNGYLVTGNSLEVIYKDHPGLYFEIVRMYETNVCAVEKFFRTKEQAQFLAHKLVTDAFNIQKQCDVLNKKEADSQEKQRVMRSAIRREERKIRDKEIEEEVEVEARETKKLRDIRDANQSLRKDTSRWFK